MFKTSKLTLHQQARFTRPMKIVAITTRTASDVSEIAVHYERLDRPAFTAIVDPLTGDTKVGFSPLKAGVILSSTSSFNY